MCLACVAASSPEIVVILGGYAATRWGKPVRRLRSAFGGRADTEAAELPGGRPDPVAELISAGPVRPVR